MSNQRKSHSGAAPHLTLIATLIFSLTGACAGLHVESLDRRVKPAEVSMESGGDLSMRHLCNNDVYVIEGKVSGYINLSSILVLAYDANGTELYSRTMAAGSSHGLSEVHSGFAPFGSGFVLSLSEVMRAQFSEESANCFMRAREEGVVYVIEIDGVFRNSGKEATAFSLRYEGQPLTGARPAMP